MSLEDERNPSKELQLAIVPNCALKCRKKPKPKPKPVSKRSKRIKCLVSKVAKTVPKQFQMNLDDDGLDARFQLADKKPNFIQKVVKF